MYKQYYNYFENKIVLITHLYKILLKFILKLEFEKLI